MMTPAKGHEEEVSALNEQLVAFYRAQPGCLGSHFIRAADTSGEQGRVSFWTSEAAAAAAATQERSLYLRSRLHLLVQFGHQDRSFTTVTSDPALPVA
jgi:quinol monooxygenase YgiN